MGIIIELEEISNKNGFIVVIDDDGLVTIQMSENSVETIIDIFNQSVLDKVYKHEIVEVKEFGNTFKLDLYLKYDDDQNEDNDGFSITGNIVNGNYYHDFELEYCDLETWDKIKKIVNS